MLTPTGCQIKIFFKKLRKHLVYILMTSPETAKTQVVSETTVLRKILTYEYICVATSAKRRKCDDTGKR